jgi:uncharacterized membrane-anchored protein YitT (DUF2179 family)
MPPCLRVLLTLVFVLCCSIFYWLCDNGPYENIPDPLMVVSIIGIFTVVGGGLFSLVKAFLP